MCSHQPDRGQTLSGEGILHISGGWATAPLLPGPFTPFTSCSACWLPGASCISGNLKCRHVHANALFQSTPPKSYTCRCPTFSYHIRQRHHTLQWLACTKCSTSAARLRSCIASCWAPLNLAARDGSTGLLASSCWCCLRESGLLAAPGCWPSCAASVLGQNMASAVLRRCMSYRDGRQIVLCCSEGAELGHGAHSSASVAKRGWRRHSVCA